MLWQTIFSSVWDQGKRCHGRPRRIISRLNATLWHEAFNRSITPPCFCCPLKNRLWRKADISLTYRSSAGGEWAPGSLTERTEAELDSWNITESIGKAIDGKVWKHWDITSDWQLIPTWESTRQYQQICMCWGKGVRFNGALHLLESADVCVQLDEHNTTRWQPTCGVRWHVGWGLAHC